MQKMVKNSLLLVVFAALFHSCKKEKATDPVIGTPSFSWTHNGRPFSSKSVFMDYQGIWEGYYEPIPVAEDSEIIATLQIAISVGRHAGDHTIDDYWLNYQEEDKKTGMIQTLVIENYTIEVTQVKGAYLSGTFMATKIGGTDTLKGTFSDIKSEP